MDPRTLGNGRYELLEQIGQGGMATVWRARDTRLGVERAVKILAPKGSTSTTTARDRFDREARLMAQLEHPHVVPVHDVGVENGRIYMVMSLFRGGSVADYLERHGPMPPRLASFVAEGVLKRAGADWSQRLAKRIETAAPIQEILGHAMEARINSVGHVARGGSPSALDNTLAGVLGAAAADLAQGLPLPDAPNSYPILAFVGLLGLGFAWGAIQYLASSRVRGDIKDDLAAIQERFELETP